MNENKILAEVNGKAITEADVELLLRNFLNSGNTTFDSKEGRDQLLEELINQELLYADAVEKKLDTEKEYLDELEVSKANLLKQYAVRKILTSINVTDEEIKDYYENNKEQFVEPATVQASHILVKEEDEINKVKKEIEEGLSFEEAAKKYSTCPSNARGGDLGQFGKGQMVPEFEDAAFKMNIGEVSEPVKTQFGYHLIKVAGKNEPTSKNFEEVKGQIGNFLLGSKQNKTYLDKTEGLKDKFEIKRF